MIKKKKIRRVQHVHLVLVIHFIIGVIMKIKNLKQIYFNENDHLGYSPSQLFVKKNIRHLKKN